MEQHTRTVGRLFDEIWNGRRLELIPELYTPDVLADYRPYALHTGWADIETMVNGAYRTMPDYREELLDVVVEGDRAAVHLRISGTQSGPWGPVPPTDRRLEYEEMVFFTFAADGRVAHQRGIVDTIAGLRQAGVLPSPDP